MKITSKGQVTIPKEIREELGLLPHTDVEFEVEGDTVRLFKAEEADNRRGRQLIEQMKGTSSSGMSTEDIMELTRNGADE